MIRPLFLWFHLAQFVGHFGGDGGGRPPPSPPAGKPSKSSESWFGGASSWFGDKGYWSAPQKKKATELGVTPPPFSTPSPMPLVKLIKPLGPEPMLNTTSVVNGHGQLELPPSLSNIPKGKCVCEMMTSMVSKVGQLDLSKFAVIIKKMPEKPESTLYDSCGGKMKAKIKPLDSPPIKVMLQQVGQPDLAGLKTCHDAVVVAQNLTTVDGLMMNLKQNSPGVYEAMVQLILKLQINFQATLDLFGEASAKLITKFVALLKTESDVKVAVHKCMEVADKGALFDLLASIKQTYQTLVASLSLNIDGFFGGADPAPPTSPPPPPPVPPRSSSSHSKSSESEENSAGPSSPPPFFTSSPPPPKVGIMLPTCVEKILLDLKVKLQNQNDMKALLDKLDLNCHSNLDALSTKVKSGLPDLAAKLIAKLKPNDLDGLVMVINDVVKGTISSGDDLTAKLKNQCPGAMDLLLALMAKFKLTIQEFFAKLSPTQTELIGKLQTSIVEYIAQIGIMLTGTGKALLDALKNTLPVKNKMGSRPNKLKTQINKGFIPFYKSHGDLNPKSKE